MLPILFGLFAGAAIGLIISEETREENEMLREELEDSMEEIEELAKRKRTLRKDNILLKLENLYIKFDRVRADLNDPTDIKKTILLNLIMQDLNELFKSAKILLPYDDESKEISIMEKIKYYEDMLNYEKVDGDGIKELFYYLIEKYHDQALKIILRELCSAISNTNKELDKVIDVINDLEIIIEAEQVKGEVVGKLSSKDGILKYKDRLETHVKKKEELEELRINLYILATIVLKLEEDIKLRSHNPNIKRLFEIIKNLELYSNLERIPKEDKELLKKYYKANMSYVSDKLDKIGCRVIRS